MKNLIFKLMCCVVGILFFSIECISQNQATPLLKKDFYVPKDSIALKSNKKINNKDAPAPYVVECLNIESNGKEEPVTTVNEAPKMMADKPRVHQSSNDKKSSN